MTRIIVIAAIGLANVDVGHQDEVAGVVGLANVDVGHQDEGDGVWHHDEVILPQAFREGSPQTVIIPGADQRYVVMSEAWYDALTNRIGRNEKDIAIIRGDAEKTEKGREKFHGKRVRVSENKEELKRITFYEDGWSFEESYRPRRSASPSGHSTEHDSRAALVSPCSGSANGKGAALVSTCSGSTTNPRYEDTVKRREAAKRAKPIEHVEIHIGGTK